MGTESRPVPTGSRHRLEKYCQNSPHQKVIVALKETIRLMKEIDDLIPAWPLE